MIRPTVPEDTAMLVTLAQGTGVFKQLEIQALREVLDDYHAHAKGLGHRSVTLQRDGRVVGFAYYAPAAMTDRTWELWWIAVTKHTQARGLGSELLRYVEEDIGLLGARLFLIDTSSLPHYELTRRFYLKHRYEQAAILKDFYADGDDKIIFRKYLHKSEALGSDRAQDAAG